MPFAGRNEHRVWMPPARSQMCGNNEEVDSKLQCRLQIHRLYGFSREVYDELRRRLQSQECTAAATEAHWVCGQMQTQQCTGHMQGGTKGFDDPAQSDVDSQRCTQSYMPPAESKAAPTSPVVE